MIECPKLTPEGCAVVKSLCGIDYTPLESFCRACLHTNTPSTGEPNQITAALAIGLTGKTDPEGAAILRRRLAPALGTPIVVPREGPGTELAAILRLFGFKHCAKCHARSVEMDRRGCRWCEENEAIILMWLKEAADDRSLPFIKAIARRLLRRAVRRARKKGRCHGESD